MNKVDSFLVMIIVLVCGFFVTYKTAEFHFSGVEFERQKNKQLVHHIQQLKLKAKVAELERENMLSPNQLTRELPVRGIASVQTSKVSTKLNKPDSNKELLDSTALAESYYQKAKLNCEKFKKEDICTQNIEIVVSQFPETRWAGESLLLLSRLYLKTRHTERAREVMKIVAKEFKYDKDIQHKLSELERIKQ